LHIAGLCAASRAYQPHPKRQLRGPKKTLNTF